MQPAGSWQGTGNQTIGFVSESGRFRVEWTVQHEQAPGKGMFRLTVHSAVSGRPLQVIADQRGEGSGSAEFADDPRPYNLMVESEDVEWSVKVDAVTTTVDAKQP